MSLLEVHGLSAGYGPIQILNEISFAIEPGECLGILGHNGMGKSTLLKAVSGAIAVTAGSITMDGEPLQHRPQHLRARSGIGYVPQGRQIFPNLTVMENMRIAALGSGRPAQVVDRVVAAFSRLHPILDRAGGVLSGGEQQILALARCLCGEPRLILLDEPTEGVQPSIRGEIVELIKRLKVDIGFSVLLVEQNVRFMRALADRILLMNKGGLTPIATDSAEIETL